MKRQKTRIKVILCILIFVVPELCFGGCRFSDLSDGGDMGRSGEVDTPEGRLAYESREVFAMDTYMTLTVYGRECGSALDMAENELRRLDELLSVGNPESDVSRVNESGSECVSEDTAKLVETAVMVSEMTQVAFDITIYPLMQEWGFTTGNYNVPEGRTVQELLRNIGCDRISFDADTRRLVLDDVKIDFGAIAKGYASGLIIEKFADYDVECAIISLGGNVQTYNRKYDDTLWRVGIKKPQAEDGGESFAGVVEVENKAVITSGGYERCFEQDGKAYHHIIDPSTGYPADSGLKSVTVVSEDAMIADALSTAFFVMGEEKTMDFWRENGAGQGRTAAFDVILIDDEGKITVTEGIRDYFSSDGE